MEAKGAIYSTVKDGKIVRVQGKGDAPSGDSAVPRNTDKPSAFNRTSPRNTDKKPAPTAKGGSTTGSWWGF